MASCVLQCRCRPSVNLLMSSHHLVSCLFTSSIFQRVAFCPCRQLLPMCLAHRIYRAVTLCVMWSTVICPPICLQFSYPLLWFGECISTFPFGHIVISFPETCWVSMSVVHKSWREDTLTENLWLWALWKRVYKYITFFFENTPTFSYTSFYFRQEWVVSESVAVGPSMPDHFLFVTLPLGWPFVQVMHTCGTWLFFCFIFSSCAWRLSRFSFSISLQSSTKSTISSANLRWVRHSDPT